MQIPSNNYLNTNPQVDASRHHHRQQVDNGPVDGLAGSVQVHNQAPIPRFNNQASQTDNRPHSSQFRDAGASAGISGAAQGGSLAALSAIQLHYPDGRWNLGGLAEKALQDHGLLTDFPPDVTKEVAGITGPAPVNSKIADLRSLPWSSIDNGAKDKNGKDIVTSKDLDQIEASERLPDGSIKMYVAIADVDALVPKGSAIDKHAMGDINQMVKDTGQMSGNDHDYKPTAGNNYSIYTPAKVFPMLPEKLSTDYTSLNQDQDRQAMVAEYTVCPDGTLKDEKVYPAMVHSQAAMAYPGIGAWLDPDGDGKIDDKRGPVPDYLASAPPAIKDQLLMQAEASQRLKHHREEAGALTFADMETQAHVDDQGNVSNIELHQASVSSDIIENLMVASNGVASRFLREKGFPTLQRVVTDPEKWDKIRDFVQEQGGSLPDKPDSKALQKFLNDSKSKPEFPEISSNVIKLIGRGVYMAVPPGETPEGHFALSVDDYSHFTAPNRRAPDLITHRMLKAAMAGQPCPYSMDELKGLAQHFTDQEHNIKQAERQVEKSAAGVYLLEHNQLHKTFPGHVTASNEHGTFVRIDNPRVEGTLDGAKDPKMGQTMDVELTKVNVEKGRIYFAVPGYHWPGPNGGHGSPGGGHGGPSHGHHDH